jgi:hypothetical protein
MTLFSAPAIPAGRRLEKYARREYRFFGNRAARPEPAGCPPEAGGRRRYPASDYRAGVEDGIFGNDNDAVHNVVLTVIAV